MSLFGTKTTTGIFFSLIALISFYLISQGAMMAPDSDGYIGLSANRSLFYPLFLKACQLIFGELSYGVVIAQISLGIAAITYFVRTLKVFFPGPPIVFMAVFFVAFIPYFIFHNNGNYILTEALCYPFGLFFISFAIHFLKTNHLKYLGHALFFALLLTLTRSQFVFLWPAILILITYTFYKTKQTKAFFTSLLLAITVIGTGQLLERTYSYVMTGNFKTVPFVGYQFIVLPAYLSSPEDIDLLDSQQEKDFFKNISEKMRERKLHSLDVNGMRPIFHYEGVYNPLSHQTIGTASQKFLDKDNYIRDAQMFSIGLTLIRHHLVDYIKFYMRTLVWGFGDYWNTFLLGVLTLLMFIKNLSRPSLTKETFLMLITLHLGNVMLIAFFEPLLTRYTFYTAIPLWAFLIILLYDALVKNAPSKEKA